MAQTDISYGWTPGSVIQSSGGFGNSNSAALPNGGATLAAQQGLARSYPSWMNGYGYQGSLNSYADPASIASSSDPFMDRVAAAQAATAAQPSLGDTTAQPAPAPAFGDGRGMGGEANAAGGRGTGEMPTWGGFKDFLGEIPGAFGGLAGAVGRGAGYAMDAGSGMASGSALGDLNTQAENNIAGGAALYRGGVVTQNNLRGPNPAGPDDGYATLKLGEGVLTAAAIKHYGPNIVARLNKLSVPKGAFKA